MFKTKNITNLIDQPEPTPHPCGNWSMVDCNLLAHGYNAPFFSDPHEEDVQKNSTLPCSPDDCNNAGVDHNSLRTGYYLIIGFGGLLVAVTLVVIYKKWSCRLQNEYQPLSGESPLLTKEQLQEHDRIQAERQPITKTQQQGYSNHFITSDNLLEGQHTRAAVPQTRARIIQPHLDFRMEQGITSDDESSSEKSSPGPMIQPFLRFHDGTETSDDESSSDNGSPGRERRLNI